MRALAPVLLSSAFLLLAGPASADLELDLAVPSSPEADPLTDLAESEQPAAVVTEYWAGHQVVYGTREVPVIGTMNTRMETFVIAQAQRQGDNIVVEQSACKVIYYDEGGVNVYFDVSALPDSRMIFERVEDTPLFTMTNEVKWGEEDIDDDGNPGMKVTVDASVCSGDLHVTNRSITNARASEDNEGKVVLSGQVTVSIRQKILGAEGRCLSALAEDSYERSTGGFKYVPISADMNCRKLIDAGWPVSAK